jgi:hypothetical protein
MAIKLFKLHLSFILLLFYLTSVGQKWDSTATGPFLMPGLTINPFGLEKSASSATSYSLQFGKHRFPLTGIVKFGFPRYNDEVKSKYKIDYTIKGYYIEPGVMMYFGDITKRKLVYYIGLLGYFGQYKHHLAMKVTDIMWGTTNTYEYDNTFIIGGASFEFGGMFTFTKRLKGTFSMNFGAVKLPDNPIPQIQNFQNVSNFVPGIGNGRGGLMGINFGVHYLID